MAGWQKKVHRMGQRHREAQVSASQQGMEFVRESVCFSWETLQRLFLRATQLKSSSFNTTERETKMEYKGTH